MSAEDADGDSDHRTGADLVAAERERFEDLSAEDGDGDAQAQGQAAQPPAAGTCPGQAMPVQATGVYAPTEVPDININGKPAGGAIWQPGMRSFWHCHAGGQIMMLDQGVGRVQKRGERMRTLRRGDTEYAAPGVEHWHGAAADSSALYFQGTGQIAGGAGSVFGDGLRCAGGAVLRLGTKFNVAGTSRYPVVGEQPVSVRGAVAAGDTRTYQTWYRNAADFCTTSTFNLTNGVEVTWSP